GTRMAEARRPLEETWRHLRKEGVDLRRGRPFVPDRMPSHDDDPPFGVSFFKESWEDADFSGLTMPRTFFGRSAFPPVSFRGSDLVESRMCWNDFVDCDFAGADLSGCDMRATRFKGCDFSAAVLRGADLRGLVWEDCVFTGADLTGAVSDDDSYTDAFSDEQHESIVWHDDPGPEAPGG